MIRRAARARRVRAWRVSSSPVQLRIGDDLHDLDIRPLVIARPSVVGMGDDDLVRVAKDAVGRGADLVELPRSRVTPTIMGALGAVGVRIVTGREPPDGHSARTGRPAATLVVVPTDDGTDVSTVFTPDPEVAGPGDGLIVPRGERGRLEGDGAAVIVDLTPLGDRGELAALVADALGRGASGFLTTAPEPVRRAAHVIRAVEHAT